MKWIEKICEDIVSEDLQEEGGVRVGVCVCDGGVLYLERFLERKLEVVVFFMGVLVSIFVIVFFLIVDV